MTICAIVHLDTQASNVTTRLTGARRIHVKMELHAFKTHRPINVYAPRAGQENCAMFPKLKNFESCDKTPRESQAKMQMASSPMQMENLLMEFLVAMCHLGSHIWERFISTDTLEWMQIHLRQQ